MEELKEKLERYEEQLNGDAKHFREMAQRKKENGDIYSAMYDDGKADTYYKVIEEVRSIFREYR